MSNAFEKVRKVRRRAAEIHKDIYSHGENFEIEPQCPEDCPTPEEFGPGDWTIGEEMYGDNLFDPGCLKKLAKASVEERNALLERCRSLGPDTLEPIIAPEPWKGCEWDSEWDKELRWSFDVCAWYQPIHYFRESFGIYIRWKCIIRMAEWIFLLVSQSPHSMNDRTLARYCCLGAGFIYLLHEFYHHKVESFGTRLEIAQRPGRRIMNYLEYKSSVYRPLLNAQDPMLLEESLANAYAYRQLGQAPYRTILPKEVFLGTREALERSFTHQTGGYGKAGKFLSAVAFAKGEYRLQQQILEAQLNPQHPYQKWRNAPDMLRSLFLVKEVPTIIIP
jgi:hypothetical protein